LLKTELCSCDLKVTLNWLNPNCMVMEPMDDADNPYLHLRVTVCSYKKHKFRTTRICLNEHHIGNVLYKLIFLIFQPLSLNLDCLQDDETGPYSPYSAYAREHIIPNQRSPPGGLLRGTYELYHDRSDTSSVLSYDSDTFVDHGHTPRHNTLDEDTIKRLRPIRAEDIKARINRHKR
jgi:hypothetical protein